MHEQTNSGLQIQLANTGVTGFNISALDLLQMIEHHVRQTVIAMWFEYDVMPKTWAEVQGTPED